MRKRLFFSMDTLSSAFLTLAPSAGTYLTGECIREAMSVYLILPSPFVADKGLEGGSVATSRAARHDVCDKYGHAFLRAASTISGNHTLAIHNRLVGALCQGARLASCTTTTVITGLFADLLPTTGTPTAAALATPRTSPSTSRLIPPRPASPLSAATMTSRHERTKRRSTLFLVEGWRRIQRAERTER